jgi:Flp pilus assembly protein TadG
MSRFTRNDRRGGQALVEFALVLPIVLFILFGILDLGRYVYSLNSLNEAARESARTGSVSLRAECPGLTRAACVDFVARARLQAVPLASIAVTATCEHVNANGSRSTVAVSTCRSNDLLVVAIDAPFSPWTPIISGLLGTPNMNGTARVTVNQ